MTTAELVAWVAENNGKIMFSTATGGGRLVITIEFEDPIAALATPDEGRGDG